MARYIFLDVEWIQKGSRFDAKAANIASMAYTVKSIKMKTKATDFCYVKPECTISDKFCEFIHAKREELLHGVDLGDAMAKLVSVCRRGDILVLWGNDAYTLLCTAIEKCGLTLPAHTTLFLRDLLQLFGGMKQRRYSFETYFRAYGFKPSVEKFHNSRYDVHCLVRLFEAIRGKCSSIQGKLPEALFFTSVGTHVLHAPGCRHLQRIKPDNLRQAKLGELLKKHTVCKHCVKDKQWLASVFAGMPRISQDVLHQCSSQGSKEVNIKAKSQLHPINDYTIARLCKQYGFEYKISEGVIYIKTHKAKWLLYHNLKLVTKIMHENYHYGNGLRQLDKARHCFTHNYHDQGIKKRSLEAALYYIDQHEKSPYTYKPKLTNIDRLLYSISREGETKLQEC